MDQSPEWSAADARTKLPALIEAAKREGPQRIMRYGKLSACSCRLETGRPFGRPRSTPSRKRRKTASIFPVSVVSASGPPTCRTAGADA
jgi:hypothetical protein